MYCSVLLYYAKLEPYRLPDKDHPVVLLTKFPRDQKIIILFAIVNATKRGAYTIFVISRYTRQKTIDIF